MALIAFDKKKVHDYIPFYAGNRKKEVTDPCIVRLKFVPYSMVQANSRLISARTQGVSDAEERSEIMQAIQKEQFVASVEGISGYFVEEKEVTDPVEFYETADSDLVVEIVKAMESQQMLTAGQIKN